MQRRAEFRPFSWLNDLSKRQQLDLSPPYQRRSVWSNRFREDFVTTVMMNYPCPAIFLFEEIRPDGTFNYKVIDGKQRITTLLDFVGDSISISDTYPAELVRGLYFSQLSDDLKLGVWRYQFSVEFVAQENEVIINDIFNRINKNVAKLSPQELRHARFSGDFIQESERLAEETINSLPSKFPNIASQSQRQMKDIENVATLLLFIENGEKSLSQADIDDAFASREENWMEKERVVNSYRGALNYISDLISLDKSGHIVSSRLKNQADFYSLFAAIVELRAEDKCPPVQEGIERLLDWISEIKSLDSQTSITDPNGRASKYLGAARAASNDAGPRRTRINIMKEIFVGN